MMRRGLDPGQCSFQSDGYMRHGMHVDSTIAKVVVYI